ncbi:MAG: hypothetical protein LBO69_03095 [Ignavibacteria bacterium]|nr:hypothetical protein [Ignavibacteria bacterium]
MLQLLYRLALKRYLIFSIAMSICTFAYLHAQPISVLNNEHYEDAAKKNKQQLFDFRLEYRSNVASMRYDKDGTEILDDTLLFTDSSEVEHKYPYTTDLSQYIFNLNVGYIGIKNLSIYANMPIIHTNILEKFRYDTAVSQRYERNNVSKTYIDGVHLNAAYRFDFNYVDVNLLGGLFLPFYNYDKNTDSLDLPINNKSIELGKAFETKIGAIIDVNIKPVRLSLGAVFNQRSEDFTNRMLYNFRAGLNSVANTEIYANLTYCSPIGDYEEKYKATYWRQVLWERYLNIDIGFSMYFSESIYANVAYAVKLLGENSIATRQFSINLGYILYQN